jgi:hypothetical protein
VRALGFLDVRTDTGAGPSQLTANRSARQVIWQGSSQSKNTNGECECAIMNVDRAATQSLSMSEFIFAIPVRRAARHC